MLFRSRRTPLLIKLGIATMIVTDSHAVRKQAIEHFRIHPDRVVAVHLAASTRFRPAGGAGDSPAPEIGKSALGLAKGR